MKDKFNIHRDSELWDYVGQVEVTQELVDFFEEDRKRAEREAKSDKRHIAFENIDWANINNYISDKNVSVEDTAIVNILVQRFYDSLEKLTEVEKRRFVLNKIIGLTALEIATKENVNVKRVEKSIANAKKKIVKNVDEFL